MRSDTYNGWTNYATWRVNLEILGDLDLGAAQDERRDAVVEPRLAIGIALALDRDAVVAAERALVAEQARHRQIDLRPQLAEVVFQRRAGHAHAAAR